MTVSLVFDIIIFALCAFLIIKNAVRGFIKSFITFAKTILAFLLAYLFYAPVARFLSNKIFLGCARGLPQGRASASYRGSSRLRD